MNGAHNCCFYNDSSTNNNRRGGKSTRRMASGYQLISKPYPFACHWSPPFANQRKPHWLHKTNAPLVAGKENPFRMCPLGIKLARKSFHFKLMHQFHCNRRNHSITKLDVKLIPKTNCRPSSSQNMQACWFRSTHPFLWHNYDSTIACTYY